jgi:hypothetical protein
MYSQSHLLPKFGSIYSYPSAIGENKSKKSNSVSKYEFKKEKDSDDDLLLEDSDVDLFFEDEENASQKEEPIKVERVEKVSKAKKMPQEENASQKVVPIKEKPVKEKPVATVEKASKVKIDYDEYNYCNYNRSLGPMYRQNKSTEETNILLAQISSQLTDLQCRMTIIENKLSKIENYAITDVEI